jgi:hypothetical protein
MKSPALSVRRDVRPRTAQPNPAGSPAPRRVSAKRSTWGRSATLVPAALALGLLTACAGLPQPYAVVDGQYRGKVEPHRVPVLITKIDGVSVSQQPAFIEPGTRTLSFVSAAPWGASRLPREETMTLRIEPCVHYVFAAQHPNRITDRFTPVLDESYPHPGCTQQLAKRGP